MDLRILVVILYPQNLKVNFAPFPTKLWCTHRKKGKVLFIFFYFYAPYIYVFCIDFILFLSTKK